MICPRHAQQSRLRCFDLDATAIKGRVGFFERHETKPDCIPETGVELKPALVLLGLAGGALLGLGRSELVRLERAAALEIASKLSGQDKNVGIATRTSFLELLGGRVERVTIRASQFSTSSLPLFTEPERSRRGSIGLLRIELEQFSLGKLHIRKLEAEIPGCRFDLALAMDKRQIRLSQSGEGWGQVWIDDADLERFILAKFPEIKTVSVRSDRGFVWVEGYGEFLIISTQFRVLAKLVPEGTSKIALANARIAFDGLPADAAAAQAVLDTLNPVVDLDKDLRLHGAISLEGVFPENGSLRAWGKTKIPVSPK